MTDHSVPRWPINAEPYTEADIEDALMTDDTATPDFATHDEERLDHLRRSAVRQARELGLNADDRAAYVLANVLGPQARTAGIKVPADALGHLREDG